MLFYLLFIISLTLTSASITSITYGESNCASTSRIGFYYDAGDSISCLASGCTPVGDGTFYEIRCDEELSTLVLENSGLMSVNYYDNDVSCSTGTGVLAYGGIPGNNAVNINKQFNGGWISVQFVATDSIQFTKCELSETPACTTLFVPSDCSTAPNLEAGSYWKYLTPSSTPVQEPISSPTSAPYPPADAPGEAPADVAPIPTDIPPVETPQQPDKVRCNCASLSNCHCRMSCQMVDDVITCTLG